MPIYRVWLAKNGVEAEYHMEGNRDTMEEMSMLAAKAGVTCNVSTMESRFPETIMEQFRYFYERNKPVGYPPFEGRPASLVDGLRAAAIKQGLISEEELKDE